MSVVYARAVFRPQRVQLGLRLHVVRTGVGQVRELQLGVLLAVALLSLGCDSEAKRHAARAALDQAVALDQAEQLEHWASIWTEERVDEFCAGMNHAKNAHEFSYMVRKLRRIDVPIILGCLYEHAP